MSRPKAFPFQKKTVYRIEEFGGRALLGHEMGLGKTLCSLWFMKRQRLDTLPALVVCPASVKWNWVHEAETHVGLRTLVLEGQKPSKRLKLGNVKVVIINYDILKHWLPVLEKLKFKTIVFDECHYLQNRRTQRTKAATRIATGIPHCLALSGTPLTNRPSELFTSLHILVPEEFPAYWTFAQNYCAPKMTRWGWDYSGASNLEDLHQRLKKTCLIRYLKQDVLHELPDKVRNVVPLELSNPKEYVKARDNFIVWLRENAPDKVTSASRAIQLARIGYLLRLAAKLKLRGVVEWANRFLEETDEKLILFAVHKKCIAALSRRVNAKHVIIDGSVKSKDRQASVQQFQQDDKTRLFIGNIRAAGVGINLNAASTLGFAELWWKPGDHLQAEDRPHRIGQKNTVFINYFVGHETIEEVLCEILQRKQQIIREALDGKGLGDLSV